MRALKRFALAVDWINERAGRAGGWLALAMVLITFAVVILRYVFSLGFVWLQESYVWLHGIVFMLGAGYTLLHDGHVRVDIFYREASVRRKAAVDLFGALLLLLPFVVMVFWVAWPYAVVSWQRLEGSREAGGLPGLFLLKSVIVAFCFLLGLQGLAMAARAVLALEGRVRPPGPENGIGEV
jgi:TRAP-type mannitol/chloroaromatic compound transport system permease small subunit